MASSELEVIVELVRASPMVGTVEEMRSSMEAMSVFSPLPDGALAEPVDAGGVPAEWVTGAGARSDRTVLYLHGGGYVLGSINTHRGLAARISAASGARCLLIDYRLAPEHPFPAAVEDALAAYRWLLDAGVDSSALAVAGDSAGGGLTLATLIAVRDGRHPLPGCGVCLSPWVDMEALGESMTTRADVDPMVQRGNLLETARMYLGGADPRTPLAAPLYADLGGLPPLLIQVGTAETLLDDSLRIAERAREVGVEVTLQPWEDMIHVFQAFAPALPEANQAIDQIGEYLRKQLA